MHIDGEQFCRMIESFPNIWTVLKMIYFIYIIGQSIRMFIDSWSNYLSRLGRM